MKDTCVTPFLPAYALPRCAATGIVPTRRQETWFVASLPPPQPGGRANTGQHLIAEVFFMAR